MPDKEIDKAVSGLLCSISQAMSHLATYDTHDIIQNMTLRDHNFFPHFLRKWETFSVSLINKIGHIYIYHLLTGIFAFYLTDVWFFSFQDSQERGKFESF